MFHIVPKFQENYYFLRFVIYWIFPPTLYLVKKIQMFLSRYCHLRILLSNNTPPPHLLSHSIQRKSYIISCSQGFVISDLVEFKVICVFPSLKFLSTEFRVLMHVFIFGNRTESDFSTRLKITGLFFLSHLNI